MESKEFEAIREGAAEAIFRAMRNITDMPGADTFATMERGFKEGIESWMDDHEDRIIEAIAART